MAVILGYVFYGVLLSGFFESNAGSATGVARTPDELIWWGLILGSLAFAALITYIFLKWANISTLMSGLRSGAVIGLLLALSFDLIMYATSHLMNLTAVIVDVIVAVIMTAIIGGVIGAVMSM